MKACRARKEKEEKDASLILTAAHLNVRKIDAIISTKDSLEQELEVLLEEAEDMRVQCLVMEVIQASTITIMTIQLIHTQTLITERKLAYWLVS
jgi:hypothetical protein